MAELLSEEWLGAVAAAAADLPAVPGAGLTIAVEVIGGPTGRRRFGVVLAEGRPAELSPGRPGGADCTVSCAYDDARAMLAGRLDPAVAYMQGRLKLEGAYERVLFGLRPLTQTEPFKTFTTQILALSGEAPTGGGVQVP